MRSASMTVVDLVARKWMDDEKTPEPERAKLVEPRAQELPQHSGGSRRAIARGR